MKFTEYGKPGGQLVIYFHGAPGGPEEAAVFDQPATQHQLQLISPARFLIEKNLQGEAYYQQLAQFIDQKTESQPIDIIGFSIGAQAAIQTSRLLKTPIRSMQLISAAAPIDDGKLINDMADKKVFETAITSPHLFKIMTYAQSLLARVSPSLLTKMLFSTAAGEDKQLSKQPEFLAYIRPLLKQCFQYQRAGYLRDINAYVQPWRASIKCVTMNTTLWHGTSDNWSPFGMAEHLDKHLHASQGIELMEGLSHYSCLFKAAPMICKRLARL